MEETILIVDDETQIRTTLRGILSDEGYRVLDADDALKALNLIAAQRPDLVILDLALARPRFVKLSAPVSDGEQPLVLAVAVAAAA